MELVNEFTVNRPIEQAWAVLTDVEKIAPCLPGAELEEIEGDIYRGVVKVKVGPIKAALKGEASFQERDDVNHRAVLKGEGRDTKGNGNASALITASLEELTPSSAKCVVHTDLNMTGKVAQFGRGALGDISAKLMAEFAKNLDQMLADDATPAPEPAVGAPTLTSPSTNGEAAPTVPTVRKINGPAAEPIDVVGVGAGAILERVCCRSSPGSSCCCSFSSVAVDNDLNGRSPASPRIARARTARRVRSGGPRLPPAIPSCCAIIRCSPTAHRCRPGTGSSAQELVAAVGRLEAAGGVRAAEAEIDPAAIDAAHRRYAAERDALISPDFTRTAAFGRSWRNPPGGEMPPRPLRLVSGRRRRPGRALGCGADRHSAEVSVVKIALDALRTTFAFADEPEFTVPCGVHSLRDRHFTTDPPRPEELTNAVGEMLDYLDDVKRERPSVIDADVTVAGDAPWVIAQVEHGGYLESATFSLTRFAAEDVFRTLATERASARALNPGLPGEHVDTVVGGCCALVAIMRGLHLEAVEVAAR